MTTFGAISLISALIMIVLFLRAVMIMRDEGRRDDRSQRGSQPGRGHHTIDSSYFSGGGGGGHQSSFRVPKDPQEYAKGFVPRQRGK